MIPKDSLAIPSCQPRRVQVPTSFPSSSPSSSQFSLVESQVSLGSPQTRPQRRPRKVLRRTEEVAKGVATNRGSSEQLFFTFSVAQGPPGDLLGLDEGKLRGAWTETRLERLKRDWSLPGT